MDSNSPFLEEARRGFQSYKRLGEEGIEQVSDADFFAHLDPEANSIALIIKHMVGNMHSRWTDFLTTDGEKPDRKRDTEFELDLSSDTRTQLIHRWEDNWKLVLDTISGLGPNDLYRIIFIRGQEHTVLQAVMRQLLHYSYHVGQIVLLAKHARVAEWKSLSIPRGMSEQFGQQAEASLRKRQGR